MPEEYIVGATGKLINRQIVGGQQILVYQAKSVHDFTWVADPSFEVLEEQVDGVNVLLLMLPEHRGEVARRIFAAIRGGLKHFNETVGQYAYKELTCVDSPVFGAVMEYPTLFLTGNFDGYNNPPAPAQPQPDNNRFMERLTLHELGHQWFYGMSANNETREAWLDEGMTDFITAKAFERLYGSIMQPGENGKDLRVRDFRRDRYTANPALSILKPSWEYPDFASYYVGSYVKPKLMLHTLDEIMGDDQMEEVISDFFVKSRFRHPGTADFMESLAAKAENSLLTFANDCLLDTTYVDFQVGRITEDTIEIQRVGGLQCPVEIQLEYHDGNAELIKWAGDSTSVWISNTGKRSIRMVTIDPAGKIEIEINKNNNRKEFTGVK